MGLKAPPHYPGSLPPRFAVVEAGLSHLESRRHFRFCYRFPYCRWLWQVGGIGRWADAQIVQSVATNAWMSASMLYAAATHAI